MQQLMPSLQLRFFYEDGSNRPLSMGYIVAYIHNSVVNATTYATEGGSLNPQPIPLDINGQAQIWLDENLIYDFLVYDVDGALVSTREGVTVGGGSGSVTTLSNYTGYKYLYLGEQDSLSPEDITLAPGECIIWSPTGSPTIRLLLLNPVDRNAINIGNYIAYATASSVVTLRSKKLENSAFAAAINYSPSELGTGNWLIDIYNEVLVDSWVTYVNSEITFDIDFKEVNTDVNYPATGPNNSVQYKNGATPTFIGQGSFTYVDGVNYDYWQMASNNEIGGLAVGNGSTLLSDMQYGNTDCHTYFLTNNITYDVNTWGEATRDFVITDAGRGAKGAETYSTVTFQALDGTTITFGPTGPITYFDCRVYFNSITSVNLNEDIYIRDLDGAAPTINFVAVVPGKKVYYENFKDNQPLPAGWTGAIEKKAWKHQVPVSGDVGNALTYGADGLLYTETIDIPGLAGEAFYSDGAGGFVASPNLIIDDSTPLITAKVSTEFEEGIVVSGNDVTDGFAIKLPDNSWIRPTSATGAALYITNGTTPAPANSLLVLSNGAELNAGDGTDSIGKVTLTSTSAKMQHYNTSETARDFIELAQDDIQIQTDSKGKLQLTAGQSRFSGPDDVQSLNFDGTNIQLVGVPSGTIATGKVLGEDASGDLVFDTGAAATMLSQIDNGSISGFDSQTMPVGVTCIAYRDFTAASITVENFRVISPTGLGIGGTGIYGALATVTSYVSGQFTVEFVAVTPLYSAATTGDILLTFSGGPVSLPVNTEFALVLWMDKAGSGNLVSKVPGLGITSGSFISVGENTSGSVPVVSNSMTFYSSATLLPWMRAFN